MTYLRRPFSSWQAVGFTGVGILLLTWDDLGSADNPTTHFFPLFLGVSWIGGALWMHFRDSLNCPQRRLAPRCTNAHLTVFAALAIVLTMVCPTVAAAAQAHNLAAPCAISVLIFGIVGSSVASGSWIPAFILMVFLVESGMYFSHWIGDPLLHNNIPLNVSLLVFGIAESSLGIMWIAAKAEPAAGNWATKELGTLDLARRLLWRVRRGGARRHGDPQEIHASGGGPLRRAARRWRHTNSLGRAATTALLATCATFILGIPLVPCAFVLPMLIVAGRWMRVRPFLGSELLRPASRNDFIRGICTAIAIQLLLFWLLTTVLIVAVAAGSGGLACVPWSAAYCAATLATQPLGFLLCGSIALRGRMAGLVLSAGAVSEFAGAVFFADGQTNLSLIVAPLILVVGLTLIPFVYRRWLNIEMG